MNAHRYWLLSFLLLISLIGCTGLPFQAGGGTQIGASTPAGTLVPPTSISQSAELTGTASVAKKTPETTPAPSEILLSIWLPPEFNPNGNSPGSGVLKARLEEFIAENPEARLDVRVKAMEGEGGLLESLVAANAAAPLDLPDLVLLPRDLLESAALKGLLFPYNGLTHIMDDPSWYGYAQQIAHLKESIYGLPFAGDALVLAYHPSLMEATPHSLEEVLSLGEVLLYPATDPQALFTLCMYLEDGGSIQDAQGRPALDGATLTKLFEYDQRASLAGVMPYWLTQYSDDAQLWEAFLGSQYPMAVTWASTYLNHKLTGTEDLAMAPLPTSNGQPFTLANGWSWALASQDPKHRSLAIGLAEFLADKKFMAEWTYAAGYLPTRADALQSWQDADARPVLAQISSSAALIPSDDMVSSLGPALEQAVVDVLKAQSDPQTAAQTAIGQINQP